MKTIPAALFATLLLAGSSMGQHEVTQIGKGKGIRKGFPVSSPEPAVVLALAGGAAVAGGIAYRQRKKRR